MANIKTFLIAIVVGHLFIFFELWFLPYETVYLLYTLNSVIVIVTGILMIKYIIKLNKKLSSEENISKTLLNLSLDGIYIENDNFGHLFGDEVLIKFSNTIIKNLR